MEESSRKHTSIMAYFWLHQRPLKERLGLLVTFYQFMSDNIRQVHMPEGKTRLISHILPVRVR